MTRYRFLLPVRAVKGFWLPAEGIRFGRVTLQCGEQPQLEACVEPIEAASANEAYLLGEALVEEVLHYLALLNEDAAFIIDGRRGVRGRNIDLEQNPVPPDEPPPNYESVFGNITPDGQAHFGHLLDPDGSKRRHGQNIAIHNAEPVITPGSPRLQALESLHRGHATLPDRLKVALSTIHDAVCSREPTNVFVQHFTALEILIVERVPPAILSLIYGGQNVPPGSFQSKQALLDAVEDVLVRAKISEQFQTRLLSRLSDTQSESQIDTMASYFDHLSLAQERAKLTRWRKMRGAMVHAAEATAESHTAMREFNELVRSAVHEELRRNAAINSSSSTQ